MIERLLSCKERKLGPFMITFFFSLSLRLDTNYNVTLSASEPKYYQFMFPEGVSNVLLSLKSEDSTCMSVSIQNLTVIRTYPSLYIMFISQFS